VKLDRRARSLQSAGVPILPDVLETGLYAVFCGTAAGTRSAAEHAYYAHTQNRFWRILRETSLTPVLIRPANSRLVRQYVLGLTDLCQVESGLDSAINRESYNVEGFRRKIRNHAPIIVAFNGKKALPVPWVLVTQSSEKTFPSK
jgi:TDG/mug DNA glycosylase family protein